MLAKDDRCKLAPVRPLAGRQRGGELRGGPVAQSAFLVGRQGRSVEDAKPGDFEPYLRASEETHHIRLTEEIAWRVAAVAAHGYNEILAAGCGANSLRRVLQPVSPPAGGAVIARYHVPAD